MLIRAIFCVLLAAPVAAQSDLAGSVHSQERGERVPATGAWVVAYSGGEIVASAPVDEDGSYRLERLPAAELAFTVLHSGSYVVEIDGAELDVLERECPSTRSCGEANFVIAAGGIVDGIATDLYGDPIPDTTVVLLDPYGEDLQGPPILPGSVVSGGATDDRGRVRISGVPPGRYAVQFNYSVVSGEQRFYGIQRAAAQVIAGRSTSVYVTLAQEPPYAPRRDPRQPDPGAIAGRTVSVPDGSAVAGAAFLLPQLSLQWGAQDGSFRLPVVPPADHALRVFKPGFAPATKSLRVRPGESLNGADVELSRLSVISGAVTTEDQRPLADAAVEAWELESRTGLPFFEGRRTAIVNDLGEYRLHGLNRGRYVVTMRPPSYPLPGGRKELRGALSLFPTPTMSTEVSTMDIYRAGTSETVDFESVKPETATLAGSASAGGRCAGSTTVRIYGRSGGRYGALYAPVHIPLYEMQTARDGSFSLQGLRPGSYVVAASCRDGDSHFSGYKTTGAPGQAIVPMVPDKTARGTLRLLSPPAEFFDDSGRWVYSPTVITDYVAFPGISVPQSTASPSNPAGYETSFLLEGLAPGANSFQLSGLPLGAYVRSVRIGSRSMSNGLLDVPIEAPLPALEVEIAFDSGSIAGVVASADRDTLIHAVPARPVVGSSLRTAVLDDSGQFRMEGLAPGRYYLIAARDGVNRYDLYDAGRRQRWGAAVQDILVGPGQMATVSLDPVAPQ